MSEKFTIEIISPDKTIIKTEAVEVTIPSYEGEMGILKNHIPLITFLRPGFVKIKNDSEQIFFVEEGTVEFFENKLLILSSSIKDIDEFSQNERQELIQLSEKKLKENISDKEKYEITHKIESLKEIN